MKNSILIIISIIVLLTSQACKNKIEFKDSLMEMNKPSYLLKDSNAWSSIEEKYFRLHISSSIKDSKFIDGLRLTQQSIFNHLFKLMEIEEQLDTLPKVDIFVFKDINEKYLKTQVKASAHSLPPYFAAYYIKDNAEGAHEITHILDSYFWCPFINGEYGMLLNEGFSFYSDEGIIFKFDYYEKAKKILKNEDYQISKIVTSTAGDSYEKKAFVSGAFVKYLIENYGINKFKELWIEINKEEIINSVFDDVYNQSLKDLEKKFYEQIEL
ncbi:MAG: hypothetical protein ABFD10_03670 [Prolixibacteraceae bacterium]